MSEIRAAYPADLWVCLQCGWVAPCDPEPPHTLCHPAAVLVGRDPEGRRALRVKLDGSWRGLSSHALG